MTFSTNCLRPGMRNRTGEAVEFCTNFFPAPDPIGPARPVSAALVVDGLLILIAILAVRSGWKQGALASMLSVVGIVSGLILGLAVAPVIVTVTDTVALRFVLVIAGIALLVGIGHLVGAMLGGGLRDRMRTSGSHRVDSLFGALFQGCAVLLVVWMVSVPFATGMGPPVSDGVRNSTVLRGVDKVTPSGLTNVPARLSAMLNESGLPPLVSPFEGADASDVAAPDPGAISPEVVEELRPSIIHVMGSSNSCSRRLMGSGFVTEPDYVITNAHVVAGTDAVRLDTVLGVKEAEVVYFNPDVDIAVLHSPGLGLDPLPWAKDPVATGDSAVVMGHPRSGPFEASPARVADRITISGSDIYADGRIDREAYTVRSSIREGNSGGPLLDTEGRVVGVVFGASRDESDIGFALTADEVRGHIGDATRLDGGVDTQRCV